MSLFQTTEGNGANQESFVEKLVKERGEQWKDPEFIAKGKIEADRFIEDLKRQNEELRQELGKQDYSKELLSQLQAKAANPVNANPVVNQDGANKVETKTTISEDELKRLVETTLTERERTASASQNVKVVTDKLQELFGTEAQAKVQEKAKELGMTLERMEEIAKESPSAFFALVGEKVTTPKVFNSGTINTASANLQASSERNFNFYQEMRRKDRRQYFSPEVQKQMFQDRERLGDKFYN